MRLLADIGYQKVLFGKEADYSALIEAFSGAQIVKEEGPYNAQVFVPDTLYGQGAIGVKLIQDSDIRLPDGVEKGPILEKLLEISKEKDKLTLEVYELKGKLKKFEELSKEV